LKKNLILQTQAHPGIVEPRLPVSEAGDYINGDRWQPRF
jgi:hypothetical protein